MPFQAGISGNPLGRPKKGTALTDIMRELLDEVPLGHTLKYKELFVRKVLWLAIEKGNMTAVKLIWNYYDGLPRRGLDSSIPDTRCGGVVIFKPNISND